MSTEALLKELRWRRALNQNHRQQLGDAWKAEYREYLQTPAWAEKREQVMKRDNYTCQVCKYNKADQVNHLTYKNAYDEPLEDLEAVCLECHQRLHDGKQGE